MGPRGDAHLYTTRRMDRLVFNLMLIIHYRVTYNHVVKHIYGGAALDTFLRGLLKYKGQVWHSEIKIEVIGSMEEV